MSENEETSSYADDNGNSGPDMSSKPGHQDSVHATDTVVEQEDSKDKRKALIIFAVFAVVVVLLILLVIFLLGAIGGEGGNYCPGTDLGNRVGSDAPEGCEQRVNTPG